MRKGQWTLYIHKNKINGKVYVGITSRKPEVRWGVNGSRYNKQVKFWRAIQKYGWDSFEHIVVMNNLDKDEATLLEQQYIVLYDSYNNGYNATLGGEGGNRPISEETKEKIRKANLGRTFSKEHNEHLSESKRCKRPVICLESKKVYNNPYECAEDIGSNTNLVLAVCRGDSLSTKGLHLQYYDEPLKTIEEIESIRQDNSNKRPVICLDTGDWFESANACGKWLGTSGRNVRSACKLHTRCKGKYVKFADDDITLDEITENQLKATSNKVRCIETGEIFSSVAECAKHYGISGANIANMCLGRGTAKRLKGHTFEYVDYSLRKKKVICTDTGEVFDSMKSCAEKMGIRYGTLQTAFRRTGKYEKYNIYYLNDREDSA